MKVFHALLLFAFLVACFVSAQETKFTREENVSFTGDTTIIRYFALKEASVDLCQTDCTNETTCVAYTYVRPGAYQAGDPPMCYLFSTVGPKSNTNCCTSAIRGAAGHHFLAGTWLFRGIGGQNCTISVAGVNRLKFVTEKGVEGFGSMDTFVSVIVDFPFAKGLKGNITENGNRINWSNGESWTRAR